MRKGFKPLSHFTCEVRRRVDRRKLELKTKLKTLFAWGVLIVVLITVPLGISGMYVLYQISDEVSRLEELATQQKVEPPIPTQARTRAQLFTGVWLSPANQEDVQKKVDSLNPYISAEFREFLSSNSGYLVKGKGSEGNVKVYRADVDGERWVKVGEETRIKVRVLTQDGVSFYFDVPVVKRGRAWVVNQLPALASADRAKNITEKRDDIQLSKNEQDVLQETMDNFLEVWMKGEREAVKRYTIDSQPIPTSQVLLDGEFKGVQKVLPLQELDDDKYKIRIWVQVRDKSQALLTLSYDTVVKREGNDWFVQKIQ